MLAFVFLSDMSLQELSTMRYRGVVKYVLPASLSLSARCWWNFGVLAVAQAVICLWLFL